MKFKIQLIINDNNNLISYLNNNPSINIKDNKISFINYENYQNINNNNKLKVSNFEAFVISVLS